MSGGFLVSLLQSTKSLLKLYQVNERSSLLNQHKTALKTNVW